LRHLDARGRRKRRIRVSAYDASQRGGTLGRFVSASSGAIQSIPVFVKKVSCALKIFHGDNARMVYKTIERSIIDPVTNAPISMKIPFLRKLAVTILLTPIALTSLAFAESKMPEIKIDEAPLVRNPHNSYAPIVEKVSKSVVTISTQKKVRVGRQQESMQDDDMFRHFFGLPNDEEQGPGKRGRGGRENDTDDKGPKKNRPLGLGSGVIISADGFIITNNHVLEGADEIQVTLSGQRQEYKATKIGGDPESDIAILKIEAKDLQTAIFADSDKLKVGDSVLAIGSPFNLRQTVTSGIVSAIGRNETELSAFGNFIQTDASINPGNSGGALVDSEGRLVGINTAIYSRSGGNMGIGFAIPSNQARSVMENLIKFGKVQRGFLGIEMQDLDDALAKEFKAPDRDGVLVANVVSGGGAEKGGIKSGDIIVEINGKKIATSSDLRSMVGNMSPGTKADVKLYRDGKQESLSLALGERPGKPIAENKPVEPQKDPDPDVLDGVTVADVSSEARKRFGIPEDINGALVTDLRPDSPSAVADIKPGDVIVEVDGRPTKDAEEAIKASEDVKTKKSVRLRVASKNGQNYITRFVIVEENKEN